CCDTHLIITCYLCLHSLLNGNWRLIHISLKPEFQAEQGPDGITVIYKFATGMRLQQVTDKLGIEDTTLLCSRRGKYIMGIAGQIPPEPVLDRHAKTLFGPLQNLSRQEVSRCLLEQRFQHTVARGNA